MVSGEWQTKFSVSPGPGLWSLVLGPFGPDLGPGPGPELDNSFLILSEGSHEIENVCDVNLTKRRQTRTLYQYGDDNDSDDNDNVLKFIVNKMLYIMCILNYKRLCLCVSHVL